MQNNTDNSSDLNSRLRFASNFQYRNYLTENGAKIMGIDNSNAISNQLADCNYRFIESAPQPNQTPYLFNGMMDAARPAGYTESDLKTSFIDRRMRQYAQDDFRSVRRS